MGTDWILLQSKPQQEERAIENLTRQSFQAYCPIVKFKKKQRDSFIIKHQILFPRYIFVNCQTVTTENWIKLKYTYGISHIVYFGQHIAKASGQLILALQEQIKNFNETPQSLFQPGQRVLIQQGPLKGFEAIFQTPKGKDRAIILLNLLQREITSEIHISHIFPL